MRFWRRWHPDDLHEVWAQRIDRLLDEVAEASRDDRAERARVEAERALELAALLGQNVDEAEWLSACRVGTAAPPEILFDRLTRGQLARRRVDGFSFVHPMLRESLERRNS